MLSPSCQHDSRIVQYIANIDQLRLLLVISVSMPELSGIASAKCPHQTRARDDRRKVAPTCHRHVP